MKISILTGKFGMGHMTAAKAMEEHIRESCPETEVEITDWFDYISPKFARQYYNLFEVIVRKGFLLYNTRYRLLEDRKTDQRPELYHYFSRHFKQYVEEKKPDIIISTLPLCSQVVSLYKEKTGALIPLITCVTDITGHSEWINRNTDFYMVGSYTVKEQFIEKGVAPDKIYETGIPVRSGFIKNKVFGKDPYINNRKKLLVMGGGLGLLPENKEFYNGLECLSDVETTIITGKNNHIYQELSANYQNLRVLGYVNNVYDYMKQADAVITKPGGVTTFEAISSEVPILAVKPYLQQEIYNAGYIQSMNIGKVIDINDRECLQEIKDILDHGQLEVYRGNILKIKSRLQDNLAILMELLEEKVMFNLKKDNSTFVAVKNQAAEEGKADEKVSFNI